MHGGLLRIEEWEERYKTVSAELEQVETKEIERPVVEKEGEGEEEESDEEEDGGDGEETEQEDVDDPETVAGSQTTPKGTPARTPRARSVAFIHSLHLCSPDHLGLVSMPRV